MPQSIIYTHNQPESIASRMMKLVIRLIRLKTMIERDMQKGNFNQEPAKMPRSLSENVTITEQNGRKIWTITPTESTSDQTIVFLHGGAYIYNVGNPHWQFVETLMHQTKATIIMPDYPLAPQSSYQDALTFMDTLYNHVLEHTENIVIMGDSAGAGLALSFAQSLRDENKALPQQLILLAPWLDITMSNPDMPAVEKHDIILTVKGLQLSGAAYANDLDSTDYRVSPIYGNMTGLPQMSIFIGTHDLFITDARKLKAKLEAENIPFNYFEYPKMMHDWVVIGALPESKHAIEQIATLINNGSVSISG